MDLETPLPVLIADLAEKDPGRILRPGDRRTGPHLRGVPHLGAGMVRRLLRRGRRRGQPRGDDAAERTHLLPVLDRPELAAGRRGPDQPPVPRPDPRLPAQPFTGRGAGHRGALPGPIDATRAGPAEPSAGRRSRRRRGVAGTALADRDRPGVPRGGTPGSYDTPRYHDTHAVIYTSGTTGPSKGVLQPWVNLQGMAWGMFPDDNPADYDDGAIFTCWPTFHSSGKFGMCAAPMFDLRMVFREGFSLSSFWDDIRRYRCTHAPLLVVSGLLMAEPEKPEDADNPLVRVGMYPLIPSFRDFERRFGVRVSAGFGNTEVGWAATTSAPADHKGTGDRAGYHIRIANEAGEEGPWDRGRDHGAS